MNCFDIIRSYANNFYETWILKFSKNNHRNSSEHEVALETLLCSSSCQPMNLPIELATCVLYILTIFHNFVKPVTALKNE